MIERCFRASDGNYERIRAAVDATLGFPSDVAETAIDPADEAPRDLAGNVLVSVLAVWSDNSPLAAIVAAALADGSAEEITRDTYDSDRRAAAAAQGLPV